jgi:Domain of unknown function (DUF4328)
MAVLLLGLVMVANFVALWADLIQLDLMKDIRDGRRVSLEDATQSDDRVNTAGLFQTAAYLVCAVGFLAWYGRAYRNLERLGAQGLRFGKGWAIAYWFIPIANLFRPKQVMNDIWRASDPGLPAVAGYWGNARVPALFHWWWGLWLLSSTAANLLLRRSLEQGETPDELVTIASQFVVIDIVDFIPAILAMVVVWRTTTRQEARRQRLEAGDLEPHPVPSERPPEPADAPA